ncbi:MAG: alpha/beta fold hydrolase [Xanthobacteraceae bacterium]
MHYLLLIGSFLVWLWSPAFGQETVRVDQESGGECAAPCPRTAVLFVHGITGGRDTWLTPDSGGRRGAYWFELLAADPQIGHRLDIYTINYDSYGIQASPTVRQIQVQLSAKLDALLFREKKYSKVILICHSLGGILCYQHLHHIKNAYSHKYLSLFGLVITLGTPLNGSGVAHYIAKASANPQWRVLRPTDQNDYLQLLEGAVADWDLKRNDVCGRLTFHAAIETQPYSTFGIIVPEESAHPQENGFRQMIREFKKFEAKNHVDLVKPASREDHVYIWTKDAIAGCLDEGICRGHVSNDCPGRMPDWVSRR